MTAHRLFPFAETWWIYPIFTGLILALLAMDLGLFHKKAHRISMKEATGFAVLWVAVALAFNVALYFWAESFLGQHTPVGMTAAEGARRTAMEFLAGYVIEYSLSVDNLFVFVVVLNYFGIPAELRHRVLYFGILGALLFRALFIGLGAVLLQFQWIVIALGLFLIFTGYRVMAADDEKGVDPDKNPLIKWLRRTLPVTPRIEGQNFFIRENGLLKATPLFIALAFLEMTDVVFALDSVPAVFAITNEPLVVFTSNMFAILGLRNLYFLLAEAVDLFYLLKYGLGIVLMFVGLKMTILNKMWDGHVPISISLGFILTVLAIAIGGSLLFPKRAPEAGPTSHE
jgi:tellurite resistance protein TerC